MKTILIKYLTGKIGKAVLKIILNAFLKEWERKAAETENEIDDDLVKGAKDLVEKL